MLPFNTTIAISVGIAAIGLLIVLWYLRALLRQVRGLRKPGYLREFRYRVGTLRQIWPAIPALLRYFTFGGRPFSKDIRPRGKKIPSYIASFIVSKFLDFSSDVRTAKPK